MNQKVFDKGYADAYDLLYQDKDYEKECDYIEAIFKKYKYNPKTILDLGCGTGGHALILAERGYEITGVDRSTNMLEIARKKAKEKKLKIDFIKGDITKISLKRKFDAVISMFAVMSYQTTNSTITSVCKLVKNSLNPGGLFMFDCWHGPAVLTDRPTSRTKEVTLDNGEKIIRFTDSEIDVINHIVKVNFTIYRLTSCQPNEPDKPEKRNKREKHDELRETHIMRFLFPQEIKYFLEVAGFNKVDFYPFLELNRNLSEKDWNIMVVGKA